MRPTDTLLELDQISVSFDGFKAVNNLSFSIRVAELRAVIGPNGAGKTTMMDIVTGKTRADSGRIRYGDRSVELTRLSESRIARAGIGRKFQRPTVFEDQTVFENLTLALKNHRGPLQVLFYRIAPPDRERIEALAAEVGLIAHLNRIAGEL